MSQIRGNKMKEKMQNIKESRRKAFKIFGAGALTSLFAFSPLKSKTKKSIANEVQAKKPLEVKIHPQAIKRNK